MPRKKGDDGEQVMFSDADFNPDFEDPKAEETEKKKRRRKTKEALEEIQEKIVDVEYSDVMQKSYIDYSMSVATGRAIPDVRDGLKPVQRRILYDMGELGLTASKDYRKVARVVGDTMGKYHPHGDSSIGGALVIMAQDFKEGQVLVDGHGNFGSIEGDPAAAARYIECRLTQFSEDVFLKDLKENIVDFIPNYDQSEEEPAVLPAKLPNVLINGSEGIAVGMVTSIPTHNVGEVIDTAIYALDHPDATSADLLDILHGPDFPTGGIVANKSDLLNIYETGTGRLKLRGKVEVEKDKNGREKLVVTEIPYTMIGDGIQKFLQNVADLIDDKVLTDIVDISNQSSKEGIRIVFDLRKGADIENVKAILYKKTRLEDTFGCNFMVICNGKPETMSLQGIFEEYADFQYELSTRKHRNLLKKAEKKREIDEGLLKAIDVIDTIVEVIRGSQYVKQAKECLMTGNIEGIRFRTKKAEKQAQMLEFTELQADSILDLRLARLVGLELDVIQKDYDSILKDIKRYNKILDSHAEMTKVIKSELVSLKEKYAVPRKTLIEDADEIVIQEKPEEILPVEVLIDRFGYVKCVDAALFDKDPDKFEGSKYMFRTETDKKLLIFTEEGRCHSLKVRDIPFGKAKDKGIPLDNITGYDSKTEQIVTILLLESGKADKEVIFVSSDGLVKRVALSEFDVSRKSVDSTKLAEGAKVAAMLPYSGKTLMLISERGYSIRFQQDEIPQQGKGARGAMGMKLEEGDRITEVKEDGLIRLSKRGGKGKKR